MTNAMTKFLTALFAGLALAGTAQAQLMDKKALTLAEARKAVAAAAVEARRNNWPMVIAVVDEAGFLLTLDRMDKAQLASVDIAVGKARTAVMFKRPSAALEDAVNRGRSSLLSLSDHVMLQGGIPVVVNGEIIGAVGVSGMRSDQDEQVAKAGVAAIAPIPPIPAAE